jgi:hypothetical protein
MCALKEKVQTERWSRCPVRYLTWLTRWLRCRVSGASLISDCLLFSHACVPHLTCTSLVMMCWSF